MIFVLGGLGLVGSAFVRQCTARGWEVAAVDRDNYDEWAGKRCRILVNANGNSRKPLARENPLAEFDASVRSVRRSLIDFPCDLYVHISTCDVYPDCSSPETTRESQALDVAAQSPYGFHKYLAEQCVRHGAPNHLILRMGGFVGPGLKKNAIYDILNGGPLWLDPASELQFLHTDEAARIALDLAVQSTAARDTYNLCGRGLVRLSEVIEAAGRRVPVKPGSPKVRYEVSIAKISALFDVPPTRPSVLEFVKREVERATVAS